MYLLISFRKSTPPQNRQLNILISNSKQKVQNFVGGGDFCGGVDADVHAAEQDQDHGAG